MYHKIDATSHDFYGKPGRTREAKKKKPCEKKKKKDPDGDSNYSVVSMYVYTWCRVQMTQTFTLMSSFLLAPNIPLMIRGF